MRRQARPAPFARRRVGSRLRDLSHLKIEQWPSYLKMARGILVEELNLQNETAGKILKDSLVAAHACARRMEQSALDIFQMRNRKKLRKTFARMARCLKRLPASQRRAIDGEVRIYLRQMPMDLAELYRQKVMNLAEALNEEDTRLEAAECLRELIEENPARAEEWPAAGRAVRRAGSPPQPCKQTPPFQGNGGANNAGCGGSTPLIPNTAPIHTKPSEIAQKGAFPPPR